MTKARKPAEDRHIVTALLRGLDVLRCFNVSSVELTTGEIAKLLRLPQPTVWRLCNTLVTAGYLVPIPGSARLRVSPSVLALGTASLRQLGYIEAIKPDMQRVADEFHGAVSLGMRDRDGVLILQRCVSDSRLTLNFGVGSVLPFETTALGWACFVTMTAEEQEAVIAQVRVKYPHHSQKIEANLAASLEFYRLHGYVYNAGATGISISAITAPVVSSTGKTYTIGCAGATDDLPETKLLGELAPTVMNLVKLLKALLPADGR